MDKVFTVAEARAYLMGEDIAPMSADEQRGDGEPSVDVGFSGEERDSASEPAAHLETSQPDGVSEEATSFAGDMVGLGVDIVEIERMHNILARRPAFAQRTFSAQERAYCSKKAKPEVHYALRFAAKEAVVKALGAGFDGIWVRDIEVERAKSGKPRVKLSGKAAELAREQGVRDMSLSLSHTHTEAVACVMAITQAAVAATEKRKDPAEELARQFKATRKMLDEL